jgi:plasmid stabilization system protein ParE
MLPRDLKPEQFKSYPPEARKLVVDYLAALQPLPLSFVPSLLKEIIEFDFKFPVERRAIESELENLRSLSSARVSDWFQEFAAIHLSASLEHADWVNAPGQFVEQLSAHLWSTHQQDAFRLAAVRYADRLRAAVPPEALAMPRLGITIIGKGVDSYEQPLFRKLRPHGAYCAGVNPQNGVKLLLDTVAARAKAHPAPYAHWYIDGGEKDEHDPALTVVSYDELAPARAALLRKMQTDISRPGMGPETLRTHMAEIQPSDVGLDKLGDAVLSRFQLKLLTEGSGTQIYSTTFAQWAARETLRRAQPLTLLVRFAPRQRQKPMNELLSANDRAAETDLIGSLVDGDMGSYYNWINQQRLPGADRCSFLVWFENHNSAVVIGPSVPRGTESSGATDMAQLLSWIA